MIVIYEKSFDWNEWFVIISILLLNLLILITPKIFSLIEGMAHYIFGIMVVHFLTIPQALNHGIYTM
ncbi:hypothetical protein [Bacillus litorisediminis]|uniref:hypothetical protein n=1 Tax=Bacillus litorisediminis TaxID=2922713 RepID=UPI001FABF434|nr:hypothetical protein [Bacillus litorisediminis]